MISFTFVQLMGRSLLLNIKQFHITSNNCYDSFNLPELYNAHLPRYETDTYIITQTTIINQITITCANI